jgi:hypothetical protein
LRSSAIEVIRYHLHTKYKEEEIKLPLVMLRSFRAEFILLFAIKSVFPIPVEFFWVVTPDSVVIGNQRFRDPFCPHFQAK